MTPTAKKRFLKKLAQAKIFILGPKVATTGARCPVFLDQRRMFSDPEILKIIGQELGKIIQQLKPAPDLIAGGETAGLPVATLVSLFTNCPMIYVRKEAKGHGISNLVEGQYHQGAKVVLVDDAFSFGQGKRAFITTLKKFGLKVIAVAVVINCFERRRVPGYLRIPVYWLVSWRELALYLNQQQLLSHDLLELTLDFLKNPSVWQSDKKRWEWWQRVKPKLDKYDGK